MQYWVTVAKTIVVKDDAQDLVEYGLLAALIALAAMTAVTTVGTTIKTVFWDVIGNGFF